MNKYKKVEKKRRRESKGENIRKKPNTRKIKAAMSRENNNDGS